MRGLLIAGAVLISAVLVSVLIVLLRVQMPMRTAQEMQRPGSVQPAGQEQPAQREARELVLYCGRSEKLVAPLIRQFIEATGIAVKVLYNPTARLVVQLKEEGDRSPADVFWAQDAGALGAMVSDKRFLPLAPELLQRVNEAYRNPEGLWVATSGRVRVLAYSTKNVTPEELPASVFDLVGPVYADRVGWAPANASFQAFVTAMRKQHGDEDTRQWLTDMAENGTRAYAKNTAILQGIANGEVDFGLPNHYYLLRFTQQDENFPVVQTDFADGDVGNLVNVAGIGMLSTCRNREAAEALIAFLLSSSAQDYFVSKTFEYPVVPEASAQGGGLALEELQQQSPRVDLDLLEDLKGTQAMLREVGLL